jgi:hypothetical protein
MPEVQGGFARRAARWAGVAAGVLLLLFAVADLAGFRPLVLLRYGWEAITTPRFLAVLAAALAAAGVASVVQVRRQVRRLDARVEELWAVLDRP